MRCLHLICRFHKYIVDASKTAGTLTINWDIESMNDHNKTLNLKPAGDPLTSTGISSLFDKNTCCDTTNEKLLVMICPLDVFVKIIY